MFGFKSIIFGIAAIAVTTALGLVYKHYTGLLTTITALEVNNAKMEIAFDLQEETINAAKSAIDEWEAAQDKLKTSIDELYEISGSSQREIRRINDVFSQHNFDVLTRRKPGLIQRRVNLGTSDIIRMLECSTGSPRRDCPSED